MPIGPLLTQVSAMRPRLGTLWASSFHLRWIFRNNPCAPPMKCRPRRARLRCSTLARRPCAAVRAPPPCCRPAFGRERRLDAAVCAAFLPAGSHEACFKSMCCVFCVRPRGQVPWAYLLGKIGQSCPNSCRRVPPGGAAQIRSKLADLSQIWFKRGPIFGRNSESLHALPPMRRAARLEVVLFVFLRKTSVSGFLRCGAVRRRVRALCAFSAHVSGEHPLTKHDSRGVRRRRQRTNSKLGR